MLDPQSLLVSFEGNLCLSGGAKGADAQWGMTAGKAGHSVIHWSYEGHKAQAPEQEVVRLTKEQLEVADSALHRANETLKRTVPTWKPWLCNLLRRNYYQVKWTGAVYGVGKLIHGQVDGGTAWAIQMYLDRFSKDGEDPSGLKLYFFCQTLDAWFIWDGGWRSLGGPPPAPQGIWTGIGSRDLLKNGKDAIRSLMGYTPNT